MPRLRHLLAAIACAAIVTGVAAGPAQACTCAGGSPAEKLARNDIAFVGTVLSRRASEAEAPPPGLGTYVYRIRVERTYKGSLPGEIDVTITSSGPTCGFEPAVGSRLGLLLDDGKPYGAGICNVITPEALDRATRSPVTPLGRGRVSLLAVGAFGARTSVAALDRRGRVLAYGSGEGGSALSVCPGSRRFVQAGEDLLVRRTRDLRVLSLTRLPIAAAGVRCLDAAARGIVVSATHDSRDKAAAGVVLLRAGRTRVLARGTQPYAYLGRRRAAVTGGMEGDARASIVDCATGRTRRVLRTTGFPVGLALDDRERLLALAEVDIRRPADGTPARLHVADLRTGRLRSLALPAARAGQVVWLSGGRFAVLNFPDDRPEGQATVYDARLRVAGGLPDLGTPLAARLGAGVVGVNTRGYLVGSTPSADVLRRIGLLPTAEVQALAEVPGAPAVRGADPRVPQAARAATLNGCSSPTPSRSAG